MGLPIALWVMIATAGTAVAVVGFVVMLSMTGQVTTGDGIDVTFDVGSEAATTNSPVGNCGITASSTEIDLQITGMVALDDCYFEVDVVNNGPEDAKLQCFWLGINQTNGVDLRLQGTDGGDWCGTDIPSDGTPTTVGFQVYFQADTVPGASYTITPANEDGLTFVRYDIYNPGDCF